MSLLTHRVPRSVVGLILFGGVVLPFSLYQKADSLSKMHLANAWPFPWNYSKQDALATRTNQFAEPNNTEWEHTQGIPLKVGVVQLEEQCYAPSIIYAYQPIGHTNTLYVSDSIGLKPYTFSLSWRNNLQDPFPFHFLSQGTAKKFITSLLSTTDATNAKVIVRYKKSQPWISVLELPPSMQNNSSGTYRLDHVTNPLTQDFPTHTPLLGTFVKQGQTYTRPWPIFPSHLWPSRRRVYGQSSSFLTYPFYRNEGSTLLTGLMTPIALLATGVYSWKLKRTQPLLVVGVLAWAAGISSYAYMRPHLTPAMEFTNVPLRPDSSVLQRLCEYFVAHRYVKSYGLLKARECHRVVAFDKLSS
jgi:hypothetical protein